MTQAAAKFWLARCRQGTPPAAGSPCAALIWQDEELTRLQQDYDRLFTKVQNLRAMRDKARHIAEHHPDPAAAGAALAILKEARE